MKRFHCSCGNILHFENTQCLTCGRKLGFLPDRLVISPLEQSGPDHWRALKVTDKQDEYRQCSNYSVYEVCNWMVPADDPIQFCQACRLNHIIPNLNEAKNRTLWYRIELAKRRLLYTLLQLELPVIGKDEDPETGLAFEFLEEAASYTEFTDCIGDENRVITGHRHGMITINLAEADHSAREDIREKMNELYRTLLGHFRHEIGHYYWSLLVESTPLVDEARKLFGDERTDYTTALNRFYSNSNSNQWKQQYISAYASAHPWEDWAESWAHYMHMVDTLETAHDFGFSIQGERVAPPLAAIKADAQYAAVTGGPCITFETLLNNWINLTTAMNALNRSMGLPDAYPFVLSDRAIKKLRFIHQLIQPSTTSG